MKHYQVVGYFQAKSRASVIFLREELQLFISKRNYFNPFRGFLYNQNLKKGQVKNFHEKSTKVE